MSQSSPRLFKLSDTYLVTYHLVMPRHANPLGILFGGYMMEWIVESGTINTMRFSGRNSVLGFIDNLFFINPVRVGDTVIYRTWIVRVRRTSMEVYIEVLSRTGEGEYFLSSIARAIYVALDHNYKPVDTGFRVYGASEWENNMISKFEKWRAEVDKLIERYTSVEFKPAYTPRYAFSTIRRVSFEDAMPESIMYAGNLLRYLDEISSILSSRYAGGSVVTASLDQLIFKKPIRVGDIIKLTSTLTRTWKSSMEIKTVVTRLSGESEEKLVEAYSTFVKIGLDGRPQPLEPYQPTSPEEYEEWIEADARRQRRFNSLREVEYFKGKKVDIGDLRKPEPIVS
ncbi:MAG: hotdog domain-containing protein [Sulfolobales archaeon]